MRRFTQFLQSLPRNTGNQVYFELGLAVRYLGLALLAVGVASSTLTFNWTLYHRLADNFFPEFAGSVLYLSDIFLVLGIVIWSLGWYLTSGLRLRTGPWYVFAPICVLTVLSVLSTIWSVDAAQTAYVALRRTILLGLYLVIVTESSRCFIPMVIAVAGVAALHTGVALAQVVEASAIGLGQLGEIGEGAFLYEFVGRSRGYGLGFNPNPVGMIIATGSILAYGLFLSGRNMWPGGVVALLAFLWTFAGLSATVSRSAFIGWALAMAVVTVLIWIGSERRRPIAIRVMATAVCLFLVIQAGVLISNSVGAAARPGAVQSNPIGVQNVWERLQSADARGGFQGRVRDWRLSFPIIRENLALGVGAGSYPIALKERLAPDSFAVKWTPVHNVPLTNIAELGVIGGVAWVFLMAGPLIWVVSRISTRRFELHPLIWVGPLIVLLFEGLLDFPPWATQDGRVVMIAVLGLWAAGIGVNPEGAFPNQTGNTTEKSSAD